MASQPFIGWELLYMLIEKDLKKPADILISIVHHFLIQNSFQNIGVGDDRTLSPEDKRSEQLPEGWNEMDSSYSIRYVTGSDVYILHGVLVEELLLINLVNGESKEVSSVTFDVNEVVKNQKGSLTTLVPEINNVLDRIRKELIEPVFNNNKKETQTQTTAPQTERPTEHRPLPYGGNELYQPYHQDMYPDPLRNIGRSDLDPLGYRGGGMIFNPPMRFDPTRPGYPGLPRGVPPGARFDPYRDPNPDGFPRYPGSGSGEFRPPGFGDDMFM